MFDSVVVNDRIYTIIALCNLAQTEPSTDTGQQKQYFRCCACLVYIATHNELFSYIFSIDLFVFIWKPNNNDKEKGHEEKKR